MVFDMRDKIWNDFREVAMAVEEIYGLPLVIDDEYEIVGYYCPHCGEPIYFEDWKDNYIQYLATIAICPICCEDLEVC